MESTNENKKHDDKDFKDDEEYCLIFDETSDSDNDSDLNFDTNTDDGIGYEADNCCTSNQKQASYYEQECNQHDKIKPMNTSDLRKTFNEILSNYDTCTEQMKLVINSIALFLNEIAQIDGQTCDIFRHVNKNDANKDYTIK